MRLHGLYLPGQILQSIERDRARNLNAIVNDKYSSASHSFQLTPSSVVQASN